MSRKIVVNPVTRVEGHGKITLHLDERGEVEKAYFHNIEFRGFEKFCEGRPFYEMPVFVQRSCGICPVSHHLAAAKATDMILGVQIPPTAAKLREIMHLGQFVQSHAVHFFHLASPDLLFGFDAAPAVRNIVGVVEKHPDVAIRGIKIRKFGQEVIKVLAGKKIHPRFAIPGGVSRPLSPEGRDWILSEIDWVIEETRKTIGMLKEIADRMGPGFDEFARFPSFYLGMVDERGRANFYDGTLRFKAPSGKIVDEFPGERYLEKIAEHVESWSYMKFPYYKELGYPDGTYRVGPLARVNVADSFGTELADRELAELRQRVGGMVEGTLYYHYARLIEGLYAAERIKEMLLDPEILDTEVRAMGGELRPEGIGVLEAPRGTLFHHYWVDENGTVVKANLIVATGNNNSAINRSVEMAARSFVKGGEVKEGMLNALEVAVRAYDPCLSCSTHAVGRMPLRVELFDRFGNPVRTLVKGS